MLNSLGIMSGTSLDGLDISLIKSNGENKIIPIYNITYKYSQEFKDEIGLFIKFVNTVEPLSIKNLKKYKLFEKKINNFLFEKIKQFVHDFKISNNFINIIGLHGQTIFHSPKYKASIQVGCGSFLAKKLKIPCISNFRNADIQNGGEGAPLAPIFHSAIFKKKKMNTAVINIGGISNITFLGKNKTFFSTDIGPGNTLIDKFCKTKFNVSYDRDGILSSKGKINQKLLRLWMNYPFVKKKIPKSFDNYYFNLNKFIGQKDMNNFDILATLTKFTSSLIENSQKNFKDKIEQWIICGGGVHNKTILNNLRTSLKNVSTADQLGWNSDFIESQAFAYLAIRRIKNYFSTFPETTGVKKPTVCGEIFNP